MVAWYIKLNWITNLIAFLIGLFLYKKFPKEIKTLFYFVAFGVLTEIYYRFHFYFIMKNGMPIGHFYFPIAIFIAGMFYMQILKNFINQKYILWIIIGYEIYCIINPIFIQGLFEYPSLTGSIGAIILFLFSVAFFAKVMVEAEIEKLSREPLIWINTAFLIYYASGFFYHSLYNLRTTASLEVAYFAVQLFAFLNLMFYTTISIAFILTSKSYRIHSISHGKPLK
jgi:hypothetical protein